MQTRFSPGSAWAAAAGSRIAVLPATATPEQIEATYQALRSGLPTGVIIDAADQYGNPLALVDGRQERMLVRRSGVPASLDGIALGRPESDSLEPEPVRGSELHVGRLDDLGGALYPLHDGVARISAVSVRFAPVLGETLQPEELQQVTAAVSSSPPASDPAALPEPSSEPQPGVPAAAPEPSPEEAPLGGIIDSVPGFQRTGAAEAPVAPPPAPATASLGQQPVVPESGRPGQLGDHDGSTVRVEDARALVERLRAERGGASSEPPPPTDGATVLSTVCDAGHVNPPAVQQCIRCGQPVLHETLQQRARPEIAVAVMPGGERISLRHGAVFGRRPRARGTDRQAQAQLIVVESPNEDISRSHLELRLEEWSIVAEDLGSTNGTMLERPGQQPQRLRPDMPVFVQVGDRLDIGEGVIIEVAAA